MIDGWFINYTDEGKILGFCKGTEGTNIRVSNEVWLKNQGMDKIIVNSGGISFDKVNWKTQDEIAQEQQLLADQKRKALMLQGAMYNGYRISFTKDDGDGVVQVSLAFGMGLSSTVIHFDCGTDMPIQASEFNDFAMWFMLERNKFF